MKNLGRQAANEIMNSGWNGYRLVYLIGYVQEQTNAFLVDVKL